MSRYIDVDKAIDAISTCKGQRCYEDRDMYIKRVLNELPSADVEPVRHGKWEQVDEQPYFRKHFHRMCCSVCRHEGYKSYPYCPHCGAKMNEKEQKHE